MYVGREFQLEALIAGELAVGVVTEQVCVQVCTLDWAIDHFDELQYGLYLFVSAVGGSHTTPYMLSFLKKI